MVQPQFCPPCPPPHYQVQPQPPLHSNRRRKRGNGKNELDKDTEIKHGKTCHHWATGRNCLKGSRCLFVHGWVNPAKSGICRNHRLGQCFYTERACYFQHLHIPIEEYEKLAIGTSNYQQLEAKVNKRLAEQGKNSKGIRKDAPTDGTLAALRNASTTFDRDQKVSVSQQSTWAICPPVQKRGALWSETSEGKGLIERGLFKREKSIEADGLLNNIRAWRLGGKTNINMDSAYPKKMHEEDLDSPGPMLLSSRKTVPSSEKMEQNVEIVKRELVIQDDLSVASSTDSTGSTGTEELTILKPIKDWTVNDVFHFVSTLNTAPWWKQYADVLKKEEVDGETLLMYRCPKALREDYPVIKKGHARMLQSAINKLQET